MRLFRFDPLALDAAKYAKTDAVTDVRTFAEDGYEPRPFGLVVTVATGARVFVQWVGTSPPGGDWHLDPERITEGEPLLPVDVPVIDLSGGSLSLPQFEAWLCAALTNTGSREIAAVDPLSVVGVSRKFGVRVRFHSGGHAYGLLVHCLPAGAKPTQRDEFKVLEVV